MPKQEGQKSKLVTLLRILEQRTDENHRLNVPQLVQLLENQGILAERKSIYSDIDTLRSLGYDIQLQRGRGGGYWMASRAFELSELKLLVDAVQSSSVISARTSKRIIHKLEALCSDYEGIQLQRQVYVDGRPKTDSQTLLYSIDALHTAINRGCLVQFRYKGSSAVRTVSPWQLAWENGCYYLIAYQDEKAPPVRHYRVDRMSGVLVLDEPTNHMDMRSKDILKNAIMKYDGTVVVVSHDREFLDGMVEKVYEFRDGGVKEYLGGIYYFLEKRKLESLQEIERRDAPAKMPAKGDEPKPAVSGKLSYEQRKEQEKQLRKAKKVVETIEAELADIEKRIAEYDARFAAATEYNEADYKAYNELKTRYDHQMHEWEKASYELEIIENE